MLQDGGGTNTVIGGSGSNSFIAGSGNNTFEAEPGRTTPTVFAESYQVNEGSVLVVAANVGVLANDVAATSDGLAAVLVSGPTHGSLSLNSNGSFNYTADDGFNGTDSFTYLARNAGGDSTPATVTITVNNVAPTVFVAGPNTTLPIYIFSSIRRGITPEVNAIGTMVLAGSLTLLMAAQYLMRERGKR